MSEQAQAPGVGAQELTVEQRVAALENQLYVIYLQANAVTKLLLDKGVLTHEEVTKEMDTLNQEIFKITNEAMAPATEGEAAPEAETEVAEAPAAE